jgi:hypothetical protein
MAHFFTGLDTLMRVLENEKTSEPTQGEDFDAKEQKFQ